MSRFSLVWSVVVLVGVCYCQVGNEVIELDADGNANTDLPDLGGNTDLSQWGSNNDLPELGENKEDGESDSGLGGQLRDFGQFGSNNRGTNEDGLGQPGAFGQSRDRLLPDGADSVPLSHQGWSAASRGRGGDDTSPDFAPFAKNLPGDDAGTESEFRSSLNDGVGKPDLLSRAGGVAPGFGSLKDNMNLPNLPRSQGGMAGQDFSQNQNDLSSDFNSARNRIDLPDLTGNPDVSLPESNQETKQLQDGSLTGAGASSNFIGRTGYNPGANSDFIGQRRPVNDQLSLSDPSGRFGYSQGGGTELGGTGSRNTGPVQPLSNSNLGLLPSLSNDQRGSSSQGLPTLSENNNVATTRNGLGMVESSFDSLKQNSGDRFSYLNPSGAGTDMQDQPGMMGQNFQRGSSQDLPGLSGSVTKTDLPELGQVNRLAPQGMLGDRTREGMALGGGGAATGLGGTLTGRTSGDFGNSGQLPGLPSLQQDYARGDAGQPQGMLPLQDRLGNPQGLVGGGEGHDGSRTATGNSPSFGSLAGLSGSSGLRNVNLPTLDAKQQLFEGNGQMPDADALENKEFDDTVGASFGSRLTSLNVPIHQTNDSRNSEEEEDEGGFDGFNTIKSWFGAGTDGDDKEETDDGVIHSWKDRKDFSPDFDGAEESQKSDTAGSNMVEDIVDQELANKNRVPTGPSSMVLFYTWMIVAILVVVVAVSTYQSRFKGFKIPFIKYRQPTREDKKRLLDHEYV